MPRRIAITGGGTAGHVFMGLAVAQAYVDAYPGTEVLFIGAPKGVEESLVGRHGFEFRSVIGLPMYNVSKTDVLRAVGGLFLGVRQARSLLDRRGIRLVVGLGGYASGAPMVAAKTLGLPNVIVEPNAVPGLTNRWLGELTDAVFLGREDAGAAFPGTRRCVVGTPVRSGISALGTEPRRPPDPQARPACLLVIGGSKGHDFFSKIAPGLACGVVRNGVPLEVLHHAGDSPVEPIQRAYEACGIRADVRPFFDDIALAYARADIALVRSGAVTLAELAASGLPSVVVPWPSAADDHQVRNAAQYCAGGGAIWVSEGEWNNERLARWVSELLRDPVRWTEFSERAHYKTRPDAATSVVRECEQLMTGRW